MDTSLGRQPPHPPCQCHPNPPVGCAPPTHPQRQGRVTDAGSIINPPGAAGGRQREPAHETPQSSVPSSGPVSSREPGRHGSVATGPRRQGTEFQNRPRQAAPGIPQVWESKSASTGPWGHRAGGHRIWESRAPICSPENSRHGTQRYPSTRGPKSGAPGIRGDRQGMKILAPRGAQGSPGFSRTAGEERSPPLSPQQGWVGARSSFPPNTLLSQVGD